VGKKRTMNGEGVKGEHGSDCASARRLGAAGLGCGSTSPEGQGQSRTNCYDLQLQIRWTVKKKFSSKVPALGEGTRKNQLAAAAGVPDGTSKAGFDATTNKLARRALDWQTTDLHQGHSSVTDRLGASGKGRKYQQRIPVLWSRAGTGKKRGRMD